MSLAHRPVPREADHVTGERGPRLHIIGGGGSGKTTLARRLAALHDVPHVELDVADTVAPPDTDGGWVTEGIFIFGVEPLLAAADTILWLDLPWRVAARRIVWRHLYLSAAGRNPHRGLRLLLSFLRGQRRYYVAAARQPTAPDDWDAITRAATHDLLDAHWDRVVVLTRPRQVARWAAEQGMTRHS